MNPLHYLVSLYAPHECVGCGSNGEVLCIACYANLPPAPASCCYRCGKTGRLGRTCAVCYAASGLVSVNCATQYVEPAKALLWQLKFERARSAADGMGRYMAELYRELLADDMLVIPIPTAARRVRARGYDQAVLLATSFSKYTGLEYASLLRRLGAQEQKGANRQQRRTQLQGVFETREPRKVAGRRILLVDDVVTTGATLEAAAAVLKRQGARSVGAIAFARA